MFLYQRIKCNNDRLIEDNIYLFINWFHFNLLYAGYSHYFEIETHLSLAKKIKFQLTNNLDKSNPYIFSYLKNRLFSNADVLFSKYDLCVDLFDVIQDIHSSALPSEKKLKTIIDGTCFQNEINDLINELEVDYFDDLLDNLVRLLREEDLAINKFKELKYFTNLIIAYLLLKGYTHFDLQGAFHVSNEGTSPFGVVTNNNEIEINSVEEIVGYFKLLDSKVMEEFDFYVPIQGVEYKEDATLIYNNVHFFSVGSDAIIELLRKTQEKYSNWGVNIAESTIFCKTTVKALTLRAAKEIAYDSFKAELIYFNSLNFNGRLQGEFLIGTEDGYNFTNFYLSHANELSEFGVRVFKDNPFEFFRGHSTEAKARIIRFEPHFINALSEPTNERELSSLWHYLEVLFVKPKKSLGLKEFTSTVLLLDENTYNFKEQINAVFLTILEEERFWDLGIKDHSTHERLKGKANINGEMRIEVHNEFLKLLLNVYDSFDLQDNLEKAKDYYFRIMDELYSVRNFFLHSGDINELAITRLKYVVPFLVSRVRDLLRSVIEREESFDDLANHLYSTGKALL